MSKSICQLSKVKNIISQKPSSSAKRKDVNEMLEKITKNWLRISFIIIGMVGLFESFTCFDSGIGRRIAILISVLVLIIGAKNSGEDLLD